MKHCFHIVRIQSKFSAKVDNKSLQTMPVGLKKYKIAADMTYFGRKTIILQPQTQGEVLEWLKRHAWKACIRQKRIGGSNPPLSARFFSEPKYNHKYTLVQDEESNCTFGN